jgi:hypothetical protein
MSNNIKKHRDCFILEFTPFLISILWTRMNKYDDDIESPYFKKIEILFPGVNK